MTKLIPIAVALYFGLQAADALRLAVASWLAPQDPSRAARLAPQNAAYRVAAALTAADPLPDLRAAVRLSPRDASLRVRLGLALEEAGDPRGAERALLEAVRLSRKYDPRWSLAGFYVRQNRIEEFWKWAREALAVSYRDPRALFDLAWSASGDGAEIRRRLGLESRPPSLWRAWVRHAAITGRLDEVEAVLDRLPAPPDREVVEALVAGKRINALARLKGHRALDWRAVPQEGVRFTALPGRRGFAIEFDGREPEQCDVAGRVVPVADGRREWPIRGGIRGLSWRTEPFGDEGLWVTLHYARPAGETRAVGRVEVIE